MENDRRSGIVKISELGRKEFDCYDAKLNQHLERSFEGVSQEKIAQLLTTMQDLMKEIQFDYEEE